ncbi:hypothetical protein [Magnetovibrio blakemorei]|uniref:Uncharacterized protein n=1 Tax=Magnetovibrio blakemorei TaxID=28181 RepID=A0A1E5Q3E6_9PROT|nr:hypothetical protein [Magnetovibrio blakemorei]OEJ63960.1 hypothetical protein BEN30_17030 [Magnetovibrio blakemorei]
MSSDPNRRVSSKETASTDDKMIKSQRRQKTKQPQRTSGDAMKRLASETHVASIEAEKKLATHLEAVGFDTRRHVYTVKHRVKKAADIVRKVKRKRQGQAKGFALKNSQHIDK